MAIVGLCLVPDAAAAKRTRVRIDSSPSHATIYVDDKAKGVKGYTPKTLRLTRGTHKIFLELEGYKPVEKFVEVKKRRVNLHIALEKLPEVAILRLIVDGPLLADAEVAVDGEGKGKIDDELHVPEGRHLVEITKPGYRKWERWFEVKQGERRDVEIELKADVGELKVSAQPAVAGAFVYIDGENKGPAPWTGDVGPGRRKIEIRAAEYTSVPQMVLVESGVKAEVTIQLVEEGATQKIGELSVASDPSADEAYVFVDDAYKGPVPWSGQVKAGHHKVEVRAENHACDPDTVFVEGGKITPVTIKLYAVAKLSASANVKRAEVFIDETSLGFTPLEEVDIPAKRSIIYIRKEGYTEHREVVFPEKGEAVTVGAELDFADVAGMSNYLTFKGIFGLVGKDESLIAAGSATGGDLELAGDLEAADPRFAAAASYLRLVNSYLGLGAQVTFHYWGLDGDLALDISPQLRLQVPVRHRGRRVVEFYLGFGGGLTVFFAKAGEGDNCLTDDAQDDLGDTRDATALGWNLLAPGGVQFNLADFLGIAVEGGWQIHKVYGKPDGDQAYDEYEYMWHEVFVAGGLVIIF
jgi:hypothetical protein